MVSFPSSFMSSRAHIGQRKAVALVNGFHFRPLHGPIGYLNRFLAQFPFEWCRSLSPVPRTIRSEIARGIASNRSQGQEIDKMMGF